MALDLLVTLVAGFLAVALVVGYGTSSILAAVSPERRRLRQLATAGGPDAGVGDTFTLVDRVDPRFKNLPGVPKSAKEMGRLRRRLAMAGYTSPTAVGLFALANLAVPVVFGLTALAAVGSRGWLLVLFAAPWVTSCRECSWRGKSSGASVRFVKASRTRSICSSSASRQAAGSTRQSSRRQTSSASPTRRSPTNCVWLRQKSARASPRRGVQELCGANAGRRRAVARRAAGSDRQVRHQRG